MKINNGDKVTMREGANNVYKDRDLGGMTGTVIRTDSRVYQGYSLEVDFGSGNRCRLVRPEDVSHINGVPVGADLPSQDKIERALATTKAEMGLCSEFDDAVDVAKRLPAYDLDPLGTLELVSYRLGRTDVFKHFTGVLDRPEYIAPEVPKKGDYVRLTTVSGETVEGEVGTTQFRRAGSIVRADPAYTAAWVCGKAYYFYPEAHEVRYAGHEVVKIEHIDRPVEIPEVGRRIKATTADGKTHEFEVTQNQDGGKGKVYLWDGCSSPLNNGLRPAINGGYPGNNVVKWEYVARPKVWKVGNIVPAFTVVGKKWLGSAPDNASDVALCLSVPGNYWFTTDRKIEWIAED